MDDSDRFQAHHTAILDMIWATDDLDLLDAMERDLRNLSYEAAKRFDELDPDQTD